jgi:U3-containing 90S pre-ribosomal complex subunit
MGGDDLGDDDDFLTGQVVDEHDTFALESSTDNKDNNNRKQQQQQQPKRKKDDSTAEDDNDYSGMTGSHTKSNKKTKTSTLSTGYGSRHKLLLTAGRALQDESTETQASFLWTALTHHSQLQTSKSSAGKDNQEDNDNDDKTTTLSLWQGTPKLEACHFLSSSSGGETSASTMETRVRQCLPSMKQLKTWNHKQSPLAIIVCSSARRAVQVLKDLKAFKIRTAKLFAKHLTVAEQTTWLQQTPFGLAVGTPHRLNVLCRHPQNNNKKAAAPLSLSHTKLIILDAHADPKGFTVCTLPDTAADCMEFLRDQVLPALKERPKQLKLAFC